jgi:hypothetical protein
MLIVRILSTGNGTNKKSIIKSKPLKILLHTSQIPFSKKLLFDNFITLLQSPFSFSSSSSCSSSCFFFFFFFYIPKVQLRVMVQCRFSLTGGIPEKRHSCNICLFHLVRAHHRFSFMVWILIHRKLIS